MRKQSTKEHKNISSALMDHSPGPSSPTGVCFNSSTIRDWIAVSQEWYRTGVSNSISLRAAENKRRKYLRTSKVYNSKYCEYWGKDLAFLT